MNTTINFSAHIPREIAVAIPDFSEEALRFLELSPAEDDLKVDVLGRMMDRAKVILGMELDDRDREHLLDLVGTLSSLMCALDAGLEEVKNVIEKVFAWIDTALSKGSKKASEIIDQMETYILAFIAGPREAVAQ